MTEIKPLYRISYSLVYPPEQAYREYELIGNADIAIENLARKLNHKGKCVSRVLYGFCYIDDKVTWWSVAKKYEITNEIEKFSTKYLP